MLPRAGRQLACILGFPSSLFSCCQGEVANLGVRWVTERHLRLGVVSGVPLFLLPKHLQKITTSADFWESPRKKKCQILLKMSILSAKKDFVARFWQVS